jgi:N-acetylglucosamine-6-phosphate deacetylase
MKQSISCKNLYTGSEKLERMKIDVLDGIITDIRPASDSESFDYENLAPALIDLHINGGEQHHFTHEPTQKTIRDIELSAQKNGVGYVLPTLITSSIDNIFEGLQAIKAYQKENPNSGVLGMHLEGPFISVKKRGAHLEKYIIKPTDEIIREILDFGGPYLKMITVAPENFSDSQLQMLVESGVKVSVGHSNATYERSQEAFALGINLVTHLFNAMSPFTHREPGLAGAALANTSVYAPIILDNVHVAIASAQIAQKLKQDKLFLISDALFQNHKKATFKWDEFDAFLDNGNYMNSDGNLAGATISLADAVRNATLWLNADVNQAIKMATSTPAKVIGEDIGEIKIGGKAKFCNFEKQLHNIKYLNF